MPVFKLTAQHFFPPPALAEPNGLLAVGGDLSPGRLIQAYANGIFPWYSEDDPILWWFTSPRLVIFPEIFHIPKRLERYYRKPLFHVTFDQAFIRVIDECAGIRTEKHEETWITREMRDAYIELHRLGYAHSVECWDEDKKLAGGLYGIALDRIFFGESMFSRKNNGSKIALIALVNYVKKMGFRLIDCQMTTPHLLKFGAIEIPGDEFSKLLTENIINTSPSRGWKNDKTYSNAL